MYDYVFRYTIVGDFSTGKSSLLNRFIYDRFISSHETTIGVEFGSKIISVQDKDIKVQIWDTAGQERFRSICNSYYKNNSVILIVFDVTNWKSFQNLKYWISVSKDYLAENSLLCIVSTKNDLKNRKVSNEDIDKFINENNLLYFECSSKENKNIEDIFIVTSTIILDKINYNMINIDNFRSSGITLSESETKLLINKDVSICKKTECCIIC